MNHNKFSLFALVTIAVLLFQLGSPALAYAGADSQTPLPPTDPPGKGTVTARPPLRTPPPTEPPGKETDTPPVTEPPTARPPLRTPLPPTEPPGKETDLPPVTHLPASETPTETPAPTETAVETPSETPTSGEPVTPTESPSPAPSESDSPTPPPDTTDSAGTPAPSEAPTTPPDSTVTPAPATATEPAADDQATLLENLQSTSADVSVVVVNANGKAEPLVTKKAAKAITSSVMFCIKGKGCSKSFGTLDELKAVLKNKQGAVTIYFGSGYDDTQTGNQAIFDGGDFKDLTNLTIQGGWDGATGKKPVIAKEARTKFSNLVAVVNWKQGDVAVKNVTAKNGFVINTSGSVDVKDSDFDDGAGKNGVGLLVEAGGSVNIQDSSFHDSNTGLVVTSGGDVTIENSEFTNNGTGAHITTSNDTITVTGGAVDGNGTGIVTRNCQNFVSNTTYGKKDKNVKDYDNGCTTSSITDPNATTEPSYVTLGEGKFNLNCSGETQSFPVILPNKDMIHIFCPVAGVADIKRLDSTMLPADLPTGYNYVSAFSVQILKETIPQRVIQEGGYLQASFVANESQSAATFGILYWDGSQWLPLKEAMLDQYGSPIAFDLYPDNPAEPQRIIQGVQLVSRNGLTRAETLVNFPGVFVLVQY